MVGLAKHIDPDQLVRKLLAAPGSQRGRGLGDATLSVLHYQPFNFDEEDGVEPSDPVPKFRIPHKGVGPQEAATLVRDELELDGRPALNLATFVSTHCERTGQDIALESLNKNLVDVDQYPALSDLHSRCVSMLAELWKAPAPDGQTACGTATAGSSEAIQLGGMAMKRRWKERRMAQGKDFSNPNIIMGANAQVALEKFARYFEVDARILPVSEDSRYVLDPELVRANVDENTIGVFVILGSTYTGHYESVEKVSAVLDDYEKESGNSVPIHVDAASGGFIAPFTHSQAGGEKWNFELPRVASINASGHKYGLVNPGLGWCIFRSREYLPQHLIFELEYLGTKEETFTLNFSRPGSGVSEQYFNFIRLGQSGYRKVMERALALARALSRGLESTGWYRCVSDIHRKRGEYGYPGYDAAKEGYDGGETSAGYNPGLPVVAFTFTDEFRQKYPRIPQKAVSVLLRARQLIVPNYPLPPAENDTEIMRVVVRESFSIELLDRLLSAICDITEKLMETGSHELALWPGMSCGHSVERRHGTLMRLDDEDAVQEDRGKDAQEAEALEEFGRLQRSGTHASVC